MRRRRVLIAAAAILAAIAVGLAAGAWRGTESGLSATVVVLI
jgi:hypothetical protein